MQQQNGRDSDSMRQDNGYTKIDLLKIFNGLARRVWAIILAMVLCGGIAFSCAAFLVTPMYEANVLMYVNNSSFSVGSSSFSISSSDISAAKSLVDTYIVILKTRLTLSEVIAAGNLAYSYEELTEMIEAESVSDTEVFSVTVTSPDPYEAEHIANTIALVLPDKIAGVVEGSSVRIVDYAVVPAKKASPNITMFTVVGLLLGLMLSCAAIVIIEMMDDQISGEEYLLTNFSSIPLLAAIPDMLNDKSEGYYQSYYGQTPQSARFGADEKGGEGR